VSWVWCPTADGFTEGTAPAFYPGDDEVDWTCVDVYAGSRLAPLRTLIGPFLSWAGKRPKPIVIGEFGVARAWGDSVRARWLAGAAAVFRANPQIKAVSYFNSNPIGNPPNQQFQLSGDPPALAAFRSFAVTPYFNP
jgi:beta-mannanase